MASNAPKQDILTSLPRNVWSFGIRMKSFPNVNVLAQSFWSGMFNWEAFKSSSCFISCFSSDHRAHSRAVLKLYISRTSQCAGPGELWFISPIHYGWAFFPTSFAQKLNWSRIAFLLDCMTKACDILCNKSELGILNCTCLALCVSSVSGMWWTRIHLKHISSFPWGIMLQIRLQLIETSRYLNFDLQHTIPRGKSATYYGRCVIVRKLLYLGPKRGHHLPVTCEKRSMVRAVIDLHPLLFLMESVSTKSINPKKFILHTQNFSWSITSLNWHHAKTVLRLSSI